VGLTDFAQSQLSDIVFANLVVKVGEILQAGKPIASGESVKAAAESYAPFSAKVVAVNEKLAANPEILNSDPYGEGWMLRVEGADAAALMDAAAYRNYCEGRAH
jgi:glycine cleavage system H protein